MLFDISKNLCSSYPGLDPLRLLDYPAEDVFELINGLADHNARNGKNCTGATKRRAGDNWF